MNDGTTDVELTLPSGRLVRAALASPESDPAPGLIVIHEWWGLNDEMRATAREFGQSGYRALAIDLFDGQVADDPATAKSLMTGLDPAKALETLVAWAAWLRKSPQSNGKVGAVGFCLGGGWALNTALATPLEAAVIYYGNVKKEAADLARLSGPVQGHFGKLDKAINTDMVEGFRKAIEAAGKAHEIHLYDADHAFARKGGPNFDPDSARLAHQRTLAFLKKNLG